MIDTSDSTRVVGGVSPPRRDSPTPLNIFRKINNVRLGHQLHLKNVCLGPLTPLNIFRKIYNVRLGHQLPLKMFVKVPPPP